MKRWLAASLLLASACLGGASNSGAFAPTTGTIDVTLTPPDGFTASATLHGPALYTKAIDKSMAVQNLAPGDYWFEAPSVIQGTSIVDTVFSVDLPDKPWSLFAGKTVPVALAWQKRPGTPQLWLTRFGNPHLLGGWSTESLLKGGNPDAASQVIAGAIEMLDLQLDRQGNLWLLASDGAAESLFEFSWKSLLPGESQAAPRAARAGERLRAFTFDPGGGAWCITRSDTLVHYTAAQLAAGDLATAAVVLQGGGGALASPAALAFDPQGALWITDAAGALDKLVPRQLAVSGGVLPTVSIPIAAPGALVFDSTGGAWMSSGGGTLVRVNSTQLAGSGGSFVVLDLGAITVRSLAFDALGDLWLTSTAADGSASLGMLTPGQMIINGAPVPFVPLTTAQGAPSALVVNPPPAGSPLYGVPH